MADDQAYETMMDVFRRTKPDGSYYFSDEDVRHFLPWMMLNMAVDLDSLDDRSLQLFADTCTAAGVTPGMAAPEADTLLKAYYDAHPPHAELLLGFQRALRDVAGAGKQTAAASFAKFAGTATAKMAVPGERPEGTIPAGPMARFAKIPPKK